MKTRREHKHVLDSANATTQRGSVDRMTKEMAAVTLPIIFVFLIVEVPIVAMSYYVLSVHAFQSLSQTESMSFITIFMFLNLIMPLMCIVSSSYTIFCFLMSAHYRETLKIVLQEGYNRLSHIFQRRSYNAAPTEQEMVEL